MIASGKLVRYLPFVIFVLAFCIYSSFGLWFDGRLSASVEKEYPDSLTAIFTPETIDALYGDARLHDALLSLTAAIAETSSDVGDRYGFYNIRSFGQNLNKATAHLRGTQRSRNHERRFIESPTSVAGGAGVKNSTGGGLSDLLGGVNVTDGFGGIISGLGTQLADGLSIPALFFGIGVGVGTSTGLNLTDQKTAMTQASIIANAYNATPTGINLAVQNLGSGLAGQIAPTLGGGGMAGALANLPIGSAAFALASGIGNGISSGLNLTNKRFIPSNSSTVEAVAGNLGFGVTDSIASNINVQGLIKKAMMAGAGAGGGMLPSMLPELAAAAGTGLGEGAKKGLGFGGSTTATSTMQNRQATQMVDLPKTVNVFMEGLSESLLTGVDFAKVMAGLNLAGGDGMMNIVSMANVQAMIPALAAGAGSGIGLGASIGLGFTALSTTPTISGGLMGKFSADDMNTALAAEGFTQNLVTSFLANSTALTTLMAALKDSQPELLKSSQSAMAAEGFARGAMEGILNGMSSAGGLKNLISGDIPMDAMMNVPVLGLSKFDDSVNGTAISFARGLTGEGIILVAQVLRNITKNANLVPTQNRKRRLDTEADEFSAVPHSPISARQGQDQGNGSVPVAIDESTVSMGVQMAIDKLTCSGIGGIASVGLGIFNNVKANASTTKGITTPLDSRVLAMLPTGPVTFTSEGNRYIIVLKDATASINGLGIVPFGVLTALHILLVSLGFLIFLPLYLIFGVAWRFSVIARHPLNEAKNRRIRLWFLVIFFITAVSGIILGMIGLGNAVHFNSAHAIFGLVAFILMFPAFITTIMRLRTKVSHPLPSAFVGVKGFALVKTNQRIYVISSLLLQVLLALGQTETTNGFTELRAISICVVDAVLTSPSIATAMALLLMLQITATGLVGLRQWLEQHIAKREIAAEKLRLETGSDEKSDSESVETIINRKSAPAPLNLVSPRTPLLQKQRTTSLRISMGDRTKSPLSDNPFADQSQLTNGRSRGGDDDFYMARSPYDQRQQSSPRARRYSSDNSRPTETFYNMPVPYAGTPTNYGATSSSPFNPQLRSERGRPSSELVGGSMFESRGYEHEGGIKGFTAERRESAFENPRRVPGTPLPKTKDVTMEDLYPPFKGERSFSRPFEGDDGVKENRGWR